MWAISVSSLPQSARGIAYSVLGPPHPSKEVSAVAILAFLDFSIAELEEKVKT